MAGQENPRQSWDAFWAEIEAESGERTETIRGITVKVPTGLPLKFTRRVEQLQDSDRLEDVAELLADLFGKDTYEAWVEAGMTMLELQTVLAWAIAQGTGQDMTFRQAYDTIRERQGKAEKGKTRSTRSAGTGGR